MFAIQWRARYVAAIGAAALSTPVAAHVGTGLPGGLESGFRHPLGGADHLLAMISVGLWGAILGRPLIHLLPVIFPAMMVAGAIMGMRAVPLPPVEIGIAASVLILGACIALSVRGSAVAAATIVAVFGVFHGYSHGRELPSAADPIGYSAGFVFATGLLHASGIGVGLLNEWPAGARAIRCTGGLIVLMGVWFLYRAIVP